MRKTNIRTYKINKKAIGVFGISLLILLYTFVYSQDAAAYILSNAGLDLILSAVESNTGLGLVKPDDDIYSLSKILFGHSFKNPENILISVSSVFAEPKDNSVSAGSEVSLVINNAPVPEASQHPEESGHTPPPAVSKNSGTKEMTIEQKSGGTVVDNTISINNQTKLQIDMSYLNNKTSPIKLTKKPTVLIFHTHTTESYTSSASMKIDYTDKERTTDENFNMIRVGNELEKALKKEGLSVIHNKTLHDYPSYNASYNNSYETVEKILAENPDICVVLDIHRDAIYDNDDNRIKLTADIGGEKAAQVMSVVGSDELGFKHDSWQKNLKFAYMLQKEYLNIDINFARPINIRSARFNQNLSNGALIIEVGTSGNSLEEALVSAKYVASALAKTISKCK